MTSSSSSREHTSKEPPVELWYSRCGAATASAIAVRKRWLQSEFSRGGSVLRSLRDSDDDAVLASHYHHGLSGLFREGGNIPPIWARSRGRDTVVLGITWLDEYQGILSRTDGPIRNVADLAGKRLALPLHGNLIDFQRGAAHHGFVTALRLAGLRPEQATFVDVAAAPASNGVTVDRANRPSVELSALLEGRVDAIFQRFARGVRLARDPRLHQVVNLNEQADPLLRVNNGTPRPITVDREFLGRHPDLVVRYLAVLIRTAVWADSHPSEVLSLLASEGSAQSIDEVLASHGPNVHRAFHPGLSEGFVEALEHQKNFLRDFGYLTSDFDVRSWISREPLNEARRLVEREPSLFELPGEREPTDRVISAAASPA